MKKPSGQDSFLLDILNFLKESAIGIADLKKNAYNIAIAVLAVAIFVCSLRHTEEGKQSYG